MPFPPLLPHDCSLQPLIWRDYRGDIGVEEIDKFMPLVADTEDEGAALPIVSSSGTTFVYIKHNNVYVVGATKANANVMLMFVFLHKLIELFKTYFGEVEEESIRDNFIIIYELLDEVMDFGYPQYMEGAILQEYITQAGRKVEKAAPKPPMALTNAVSWRAEGIKHRKNEVFLDVVEKVNLLVNAGGNVVHSEIVGAVKMRVFLCGMPELRLGLNDKVMFEATNRTSKGKSVELEDVKFHQCVRLTRFDNDRTISFIPPDGAFDLMTYRLNTAVKYGARFYVFMFSSSLVSHFHWVHAFIGFTLSRFQT
jgi:AP-1 complex subunit mu